MSFGQGFRWVSRSRQQRRAADLFYAELMGEPLPRGVAPPNVVVGAIPGPWASQEQMGEDDWGPDKEKRFLDWWKKIGGLEGSYEQWKANPANKADLGGETNWGITWNTFQKVRKGASKEAFRNMSLDEALSIARGLYRSFKADQINDPGVALLFSDWLWGGISVKALNRALEQAGQRPVAGFTATGPNQATIDALNAADPQAMIAAIDQQRLQSIKDIVAARPDQARFQTGWTYRAILRWVQAMMLTGRSDYAARWLNGQDRPLLDWMLAHLTDEEIAILHEGALTPYGGGPGSQFAQLTKARHDAYVQKAGPVRSV